MPGPCAGIPSLRAARVEIESGWLGKAGHDERLGFQKHEIALAMGKHFRWRTGQKLPVGADLLGVGITSMFGVGSLWGQISWDF